MHPVLRATLCFLLLLVVSLTAGFYCEKSSLNVALFSALNSQMPALGGPLFWAWVTSLGDTAVAVVLMWLFLPKVARSLAQLGTAVVLGGMLSPLIKHYFDYPRPLALLGDQVLVVGPALLTHGFISGHTLTAFLVASLLLANMQRKWAMLILAIAATVGISRIMVGAHWPADVLVGAIVGWGLGRWIVHLSAMLNPTVEKCFAVIGWVFVVIALGYLALAKMVNIAPVLFVWQIFAGFAAVVVLLQLKKNIAQWLLARAQYHAH